MQCVSKFLINKKNLDTVKKDYVSIIHDLISMLKIILKNNKTTK